MTPYLHRDNPIYHSAKYFELGWESFLAFLESRNPEESFTYFHNTDCLMARYFKHMGIKDPHVGGWDWWDEATGNSGDAKHAFATFSGLGAAGHIASMTRTAGKALAMAMNMTPAMIEKWDRDYACKAGL